MRKKQTTGIIRIIIAIVFLSLGVFIKVQNPYIKILPFLAAYIVVGYDIVFKAARNLSSFRMLDENFLMSIATLGAFVIGEYTEAVLVMMLNRVGLMFEDYAVNKSRRLISDVANIIPETANILKDGEIITVSPEQISVGDTVVVFAGERISVDGIVISGESTLDTSAITGEFMPQEVSVGSKVLSGSINKTGTIHVLAEKEFYSSTASQIVELIESAATNKSKSEKFITKFAHIYTPIVVVMAAILAFVVPIFSGYTNFSQWFLRALIFLVVSCPCALVISVPLGFFAAIGTAAKKGVLIKGSNFLEVLASTDVLLTDKTGTLTTGEFSVIEVLAYDCEKQDVLNAAALCENFSNHPIASAIRLKADKVTIDKSANVTETAGKGIKYECDSKTVFAGTKQYLEENGIKTSKSFSDKTTVYVAKNGLHIGTIILDDTIKDTAYVLSDGLKEQGIELIMLTGDNEKKAKDVAEQLGVTQYYNSLLPSGKVEVAEQIKQGKKTAFLGDGINDAPVLTLCDVGIAMGAKGADIALQQADVIIMDDNLESVLYSLKLAKKTKKIVSVNIFLSLSVKVAVLVLSALGFAGMWSAIFADVGLCVLAVLNSMRLLKFGARK